MESYIWMVGIAPEPQFGYCRLEAAKAIQIISVIDDIYDIYGTVNELELFTDAIERFVVPSPAVYMQTNLFLLFFFFFFCHKTFTSVNCTEIQYQKYRKSFFHT